MQSSSLASGGSGAEEGGQSNAAPQAAGVGNIAASDENNGHIGTEDSMGGGTSFPSSLLSHRWILLAVWHWGGVMFWSWKKMGGRVKL